MRKTIPLLLTAILLPWVVQADEITVSAAASLTNAFKDIAQNFQRINPEHKIYLNFAGSGALLQQIAKGAPVDIFASADQITMDQAAKQKLISSPSRYDFALNKLVVITANNATKLKSLNDLNQDAITRIAISNPDSVPVGRYTKSVLEQANLWQPLATKIINTQNVRQSLDYVARGEVDAGFVYATDAAIMQDKVNVQFNVPTNSPILYPIALTIDGNEKVAASEFLEYLKTPASQDVLSKYGFAKPE